MNGNIKKFTTIIIFIISILYSILLKYYVILCEYYNIERLYQTSLNAKLFKLFYIVRGSRN